MLKRNDYTGEEYECTCDYSYTCPACEHVREEFRRRQNEQDEREWMKTSIQKIAEALGIRLDPLP